MKNLFLTLFLACLVCWSASALAVGPYVGNGNGTVTDNGTGLEWQQTDDGQTRIWSQAFAYCEDLSLAGHNDWRLPNFRELDSIVDLTRYNPAINPVFTCQSSSYWSATTYADFTNGAWDIDFSYGNDTSYSKTNSYYVRCVRAGLSAGSFDSLIISAPAATQQPGVPFPVTVTAKAADGSVRTDLTGIVDLASILGRTDPEWVYLVYGQWSGNVTIYNPGTGALSARGLGLYGASVPVTVGQAGSCTASIQGRVIDLKDDVVYQATVQLLDLNDQVLATEQTDLAGEYDFGSRTCGTYRLNISKDSETENGKEVVTYANNQCAYQTHRLSINGGSEDTPVILVPGILESTKVSSVNLFPKLSKKLGKHNLTFYKPKVTGFAQLKENLEGKGYTVLECPWDWRMTLDQAVEEYLKPIITKAMGYSSTGKVYIVAHSMGGLLVRAMIQGSQTWADKIKRLALVGTPNLGSADPYAMWEGGDPKLIDDVKDHVFTVYGAGSFINFYSHTLQILWNETYNKKPEWKNSRHRKIQEFVQQKGPSLLELMSTEEFLGNKSHSGYSATTGENWNKTLAALNNDDAGLYRMSPDGASGTVQTGLFIGKKVDTVTHISVGKLQPSANLWQDGKPRWPKKSYFFKGQGDGTVPYSSAVWLYDISRAQLVADDTENNHAALVKDYVSKIVSYLETGSVAPASIAKAASLKTSVQVSPRLSFSITGTVRMDVTGPAGNHAGVDHTNGNSVQDIPGSSIAFNGDDGVVSIENPANGTYQVVLFGASDRDFHLDIGFMDATGSSEIHLLQGFYGSEEINLQVVMDNSANPVVTVLPPVESPVDLQADPTDSAGSETTTLTWTASTESGVSGYNVYSVSETAPYFILAATVGAGATSYATSDPWAGNVTTPVMTYAVTAVKVDGTESFFSNRASNDDRDHDKLTDVDEVDYGTDPAKPDTDNDGYSDYDEIDAGSNPLDPKSVPTAWKSFPWPMFMPAVTGAGK